MAKTCFVVMGFHKKTDFPTGRTLDLDKSYRLLIKPSVDECGLTCIRADEITHSGVIDVPMYQNLLDSDLVIADLSTSNPNALYELGVRHALRPFSTIVIAENKLQYPFDIAHTAIRSYQHLGDAIDYDEVIRFRSELKSAIATILEKRDKDSPVYTYLPDLRPPAVMSGRGGGRGSVKRGAAAPAGDAPQSAAALIDRANEAMEQSNFTSARELLSTAHGMRPSNRPWTANDDYVVQRLALAVAMSAAPDRVSALAEAQSLMQVLQPATSNNPDTSELWGRIAKDLWDSTHEPSHLDRAILAYERGFCLRHDHQNGLDYAMTLNVRAGISAPAEAIADFVLARRIRRRVADICTEQLSAEAGAPPAGAEAPALEPRFKVRAALAEAFLGLDDQAQSDRWRDEAFAIPVANDMKEATTQRLSTLSALLAQSPLRFLTV